MMRNRVLFRWLDEVDCCPWDAVAGRHAGDPAMLDCNIAPRPLYTPDERRRRDASPWTLVQGILAPLQFLVFLASTGLVLHFVFTGRGMDAAVWSVVVKTVCLYAIMITGAIWERDVFGRYLFAPAFYWEDAFSMVVLTLHTLYLVCLVAGALAPHRLMLLALAAYAAYAINATQFVMKLRLARIQGPVRLA